MRDFLKDMVATCVWLSGVPVLMREWVCRRQVAILLYHDPEPVIFANHIAYLSRHYAIISLDTLVGALHRKDFSQLPPKSVVITIDDGHVGNIELLPIFKQYGVRPTCYVCTQIIDTHRHFWFKIDGQSKAEKERLKKLPNVQRLAHLKRTMDFEPKKVYPDRQALNITEIREMAENVDFQPHTQFHPILPRCTKTVCQQEILESKTDLEAFLGGERSHFSYPNGDYTERELEIVKAGGFRSARTTDIGWNTLDTPLYRLKAIPITDDAGRIRFRSELTTVPQRLSKWMNVLFNGSR